MTESKCPENNSFFKNVRNYFREYCNCTSVHGLHYFAEKKRPIFERIWWCIVFVSCAVACSLSVYKIYTKWTQHAIIVNPANTETSLFTIPFPAVTICPESVFGKNKPNYDKLLQEIEDFKNFGAISESIEFQYMSLICNSPPLNDTQTNIVNRIKKITPNIFDIMNKMKPELHMVECTQNLFEVGCKELFTPTVTHEGICHTFNILNWSEIFKDNVFHYHDFYTTQTKSTNWSVESGYDKASLDSYPFRVFSGGVQNSLRLVSHFVIRWGASDDDLDYGCKSIELGYKVFLHNSVNIPDLNQEYFWLPLNQSVVAIVKPVMTTSLESVKKYTPEERKCYFQNERQLKYFYYYSSANCKTECRANYTLYLCDCIPFFLPREKRIEICTDRLCMRKVDVIMLSDEIWKEVKNSKSTPSETILTLMEYKEALLKSKNKTVQRMDCNCLPSCNELSYEVDTTQSALDVNKWYYSGRYSVNFEKPHISSLTIFFKSDPFIKTERQETYGPTDFLANFGGLLGLFSGVSVVSLIEMIYFLSVRMLCNQYLFGRWAGPRT